MTQVVVIQNISGPDNIKLDVLEEDEDGFKMLTEEHTVKPGAALSLTVYRGRTIEIKEL